MDWVPGEAHDDAAAPVSAVVSMDWVPGEAHDDAAAPVGALVSAHARPRRPHRGRLDSSLGVARQARRHRARAVLMPVFGSGGYPPTRPPQWVEVSVSLYFARSREPGWRCSVGAYVVMLPPRSFLSGSVFLLRLSGRCPR